MPDDYVVYSDEVDYDIGEVIDHVTFLDAVHSPQYDKWNIAMKEEMLSIAYAVSVLGRYLANPGNEHWVAAKKGSAVSAEK